MKKLKKKQASVLIPKEKDDLDFVPNELRVMIADDIKDFTSLLGAGNYKIKTFYCNADAGAEYEKFQGSVINATTAIDTRYLTADIKIYPYLVDNWKNKSLSNDDIHSIIAHEVSHIATEVVKNIAIKPFKTEDEVRDAWEMLTTTIGRLLNKISTK